MDKFTTPWQAEKCRTVFIITSNFKDIAIFKPSSWRNKKDPIHVDVVYYANHIGGMNRVGGYYWVADAYITNNKFSITER